MLDVFFYVFAVICAWLSICLVIYGRRSKPASDPDIASEAHQTQGEE